MPKEPKYVGEDPDPSQYLYVSLEQKRIDQSKPYDAKKTCWVPCEKEGYVIGEIQATKGDLISVKIPGGEVMYIGQLSQKSRKVFRSVCPTKHKNTHTHMYTLHHQCCHLCSSVVGNIWTNAQRRSNLLFDKTKIR